MNINNLKKIIADNIEDDIINQVLERNKVEIDLETILIDYKKLIQGLLPSLLIGTDLPKDDYSEEKLSNLDLKEIIKLYERFNTEYFDLRKKDNKLRLYNMEGNIIFDYIVAADIGDKFVNFLQKIIINKIRQIRPKNIELEKDKFYFKKPEEEVIKDKDIWQDYVKNFSVESNFKILFEEGITDWSEGVQIINGQTFTKEFNNIVYGGKEKIKVKEKIIKEPKNKYFILKQISYLNLENDLIKHFYINSSLYKQIEQNINTEQDLEKYINLLEDIEKVNKVLMKIKDKVKLIIKEIIQKEQKEQNIKYKEDKNIETPLYKYLVNIVSKAEIQEQSNNENIYTFYNLKVGNRTITNIVMKKIKDFKIQMNNKTLGEKDIIKQFNIKEIGKQFEIKKENNLIKLYFDEKNYIYFNEEIKEDIIISVINSLVKYKFKDIQNDISYFKHQIIKNIINKLEKQQEKNYIDEILINDIPNKIDKINQLKQKFNYNKNLILSYGNYPKQKQGQIELLNKLEKIGYITIGYSFKKEKKDTI